MNKDDSKPLLPIKAKKGILGDYLARLNGKPELSIESKPGLNKLLFGFEKKKLVVIGARPSEGKTSFCLDIAFELSLNHKVLFLSLEMTEEEAMFRLLCHYSQVPNTEFYHGHADEHKDMIEGFYKEISGDKRKFIVADEKGRTWQEVDSIIKELAEDKPDVLIIDYIQCIRMKGIRMDAIDDYIRHMRNIAIEHNICVIVCSQINRQNIADKKEPTMEGLKSSGMLEELCDKCLILYYPCKRTSNDDINDFTVFVSKNKNGMTGYHKLHFQPDIYKFTEIEDDTDKEQVEVNWQD